MSEMAKCFNVMFALVAIVAGLSVPFLYEMNGLATVFYGLACFFFALWLEEIGASC